MKLTPEPKQNLVPEGRKQMITQPPDDQNQSGVPIGGKTSTKKPSSILTLFAKQAKKNDDKQEAELEKEERLDRKRRQEIRWTEKRDHHARLRWAKGWLLEKVVLQAEQEGHQQVLERAGELARELVESAIVCSED